MAFRRIALGTAAISSVSVFRLLAQFFVVPILSRLLSPSDYGVVAMAMPFVVFTMTFTDAGVGQSLVRVSQKEEPATWSTSFWLTILSGTVLALAIVALAPLAALFFQEPRLEAIIMALALVIIPQAGATIPEASLRQDHRFGTIAATETAAVLAGIASAVLVGLNGGGAWALVAQQLVLYTMRFLLSFRLSSFRPRVHFHPRGIKEHMVFGRDLLAAKFVWFLTGSMDGPIVGKVLGATVLGLYSMAFMFARLPGQLITGPLQYVLYAHLAPLRDDTAMLRRMLLLLTRMTAIVIFPGVGMVAAAHEPVFKLFLSDKWLESGTIFMTAAPSVALNAVTSLRGTFLMVMGRTGVQLRSAVEFFFFLAALLLIFVWFGIYWFVIGFNVAAFLYYPRSMLLILPSLECSLAAYTRTLVAPAVVTGACILLYWGINQSLSLGDWARLFLGGGIGVLGIALSVLVQYRFLAGELALLREKW